MLFHELAHLADPRIHTARGRAALTDAQSELYAWTETLDYLESLEDSGKRIPEYFERVRETILKVGGVEPWVRAIVRSRRSL